MSEVSFKCVGCGDRFKHMPVNNCPRCGATVISNVEPDPPAKGEGAKSAPRSSLGGCLLILVILGLVSQAVDNDKPQHPTATEPGAAEPGTTEPETTEAGAGTFSSPNGLAPSGPFNAPPPGPSAPPLVATPFPRSDTQTLVGGGLFVEPHGREPFLDLKSNAPYVVVRFYGDWASDIHRQRWWIYHRHRDGALIVTGWGGEEYVLLKKIEHYELERFLVNNEVTFLSMNDGRDYWSVPVNEDPVACPGRPADECKHKKNAWDSDVSFTPPPIGPAPPGSWQFRFVNQCDETVLVDLHNGFRDVTYRVGGGQAKLVPEIPQPDSPIVALALGVGRLGH